VWDSAHLPAVQAYLEKLPPAQRGLRMGVILQEMVNPLVSGVAFSRNPITGEDEVIVEAVLGAGTALVQDGITPLRWVSQAGNWKASPPDSPIASELIQQVLEQTSLAARLFKKDIDLEWVWDGQELFWVQLREITSLKNLTIYSNRIAKEVLPGMIKPLVWSVNIPLVNSVWVVFLTELVGKNELKIDDLSKSFYYRTYFNLSAFGRIWQMLGMPRESLEMMMGLLPRTPGQRFFKPTAHMLKLTPRLLAFLWQKWRLGDRFKQEYPLLAARFESYDWKNASRLSETELLEIIERLFGDLHQVVYYNINIPILLGIVHALLVRFLHKHGVDLAQYDLMEGKTDSLEFAPDHALQLLRQDYACLDPALQQRLSDCTVHDFQSLPGITAFQEKVAAFLGRFGHLSDSGNDFSVAPWRERPELVLKLIAQPSVATAAVGSRISFSDLKLGGLNRGWLKLLHERAQQFHLYRDQISSLYTFAYGLFRPYFLALGEHLRTRRVLADPADIFYLSRDEVQQALSMPSVPPQGLPVDWRLLVESRKAEMERCREVALPTLIYGEAAPVLDIEAADKLTGVAASRGCYAGPVKVVHGLEDFHKVEPGDVLVIPYSDVGWTPLFARAGAVVAEAGGMLSHSAIIAREYRIPAVVSVAGAMRLADHMQITVDGYRGEVILHNQGLV
jgi:phosphoenolpyruvate synthase/pyruvate phosphate dikinase